MIRSPRRPAAARRTVWHTGRYTGRHTGQYAVRLGIGAGLAALAFLAATGERSVAAEEEPLPNVLLLTIDTLRADRLSSYGYERPTSPNLDRLLARGVRFTEARTPEPLTNPALSSMLTSLHPHEHGATRNGLRMRPKLPSLPAILDKNGYQTAAFVANWTLKDRLSGMGDHFQDYREVFTRKRWLGMMNDEATAEDVNDETLDWLEERAGRRRPFFVWVHYVEPHAPYRFHPEHAARLGLGRERDASRSDRYDTEIAFVDAAAGRLLDWIEARPALARRTLIVVASDHGESLGEHDYWGHGRFLHEQGLKVPLGMVWPGRLRPSTVTAPATLLDVTPTVLGLLGIEAGARFRGFDWTPVLTGDAPAPAARVTHYQAHKGAVLGAQDARQARRGGLLEVAMIADGKKEVLRVQNGRDHRLHDLAADPAERVNLIEGNDEPSGPLGAWHDEVEHGLATTPDLPPVDVDAESVEQLKALGYTG